MHFNLLKLGQLYQYFLLIIMHFDTLKSNLKVLALITSLLALQQCPSPSLSSFVDDRSYIFLYILITKRIQQTKSVRRFFFLNSLKQIVSKPKIINKKTVNILLIIMVIFSSLRKKKHVNSFSSTKTKTRLPTNFYEMSFFFVKHTKKKENIDK